ncbi:MAG: hypothetical protein ACT4OY_00785 [Alphaproteobacteria bacterium]
MARNWTPKERARQTAIIRRDRPWEKSTGPASAEGKSRASGNAIRHGLCSAEAYELRRLLTLQRNFIASLRENDRVE